MGILNYLFCKHHWEERKCVDIYEHPNDKLPSKIKLIYICSKCGKIKKLEIKS